MRKLIIGILLIVPIFLFGADYGSMYMTSGSTSKSASTTFSTITGFTDMSSSVCTYSTDGITTGTSAGTKQYLIRYSLSFYGDAALWSFGVKIGSDATRGLIERRISGGSDVGNAAGSFIATIDESKEIVLQMAVDSGTADYTPVHSQLVVVELSEATTPKYGEMQIAGNSISQTSITGFTNLTNFNSTYSNLEGWSFASNTLSASSGSAGTYLAILSASFNGTTEKNYELGISKGGNKPYGNVTPSDDTEIVMKRYLGTSGDIGNGGTCGIITISESDIISVQVKSDGNSITSQYASLILIKIADNNSLPYAGMKIGDNGAGNTTLTELVNYETWYSINDYSSDILNSSFWEFTDNTVPIGDVLSPEGLSAGDYLVNYYISVEANKGTSSLTFNTLFGMFKNGSQQYDLTTERTLERKQTSGNNPDVAAINGTAIIRIEYPDDELDLQVYNVDQNNNIDLIIRYSNVSLYRLKTINDGVLPITLSSFTASFVNDNAVLQWTTASESNNYGWNIYRAGSQNIGQALLINPEIISGAGSSSEPTDYQYIDSGILDYIEYNNIDPEVIFSYWIESLGYDGTSELHGPISLQIPEDDFDPGIPEIPDFIGLYQNYPNPFNPGTEIRFTLAENDMVELVIYNVKGEKVRSLFQGILPASQDNETYTFAWDGMNESGQEVSSGIYLYRLRTTEQDYVRKMILSK